MDDAISREAVHDLIATWLDDYLTEETREVLETIDAKIEDMPSVKEKKGNIYWICQNCGLEVHKDFDSCPCCGVHK